MSTKNIMATLAHEIPFQWKASGTGLAKQQIAATIDPQAQPGKAKFYADGDQHRRAQGRGAKARKSSEGGPIAHTSVTSFSYDQLAQSGGRGPRASKTTTQ